MVDNARKVSCWPAWQAFEPYVASNFLRELCKHAKALQGFVIPAVVDSQRDFIVRDGVLIHIWIHIHTADLLHVWEWPHKALVCGLCAP
jgi:hypothetical protein